MFRSEEWPPAAKGRPSIRYTMKYCRQNPKVIYSSPARAAPTPTNSSSMGRRSSISLREGQAPHYVELPLTAGNAASFELDYWPDAAYPRIGLEIRRAGELVMPEAKKMPPWPMLLSSPSVSIPLQKARASIAATNFPLDRMS